MSIGMSLIPGEGVMGGGMMGRGVGIKDVEGGEGDCPGAPAWSLRRTP